MTAAYSDYRDVPHTRWRWPHFTPREIACRGDGSLRIVPRALDALEAPRQALSEPFVILSAYRSALHNARVGGAPLSRHKAGDAFDIALAGHERTALLAACRAAGFAGAGLYAVFLHVDLGPKRSWGTWN